MQALLNFLPLAAFMLCYKLGGIYTATVALMVSMLVLALVDYLRQGRVSGMHALSTVLVLVFGGATLLMWLLALAFLGSQWIGRKPLAQRMLEPALPPDTILSRERWLRVNLIWVAAYAVLGALNLYVAQVATEQAWVYFKGFGLTIALALLAMGQALWLHRSRATNADSNV